MPSPPPSEWITVSKPSSTASFTAVQTTFWPSTSFTCSACSTSTHHLNALQVPEPLLFFQLHCMQKRRKKVLSAADLEVKGGLVCAVDKVASNKEGVARLAHVGKVRVADGQLGGACHRSLIRCHHKLLTLLDFQHLLVSRPTLCTGHKRLSDMSSNSTDVAAWWLMDAAMYSPSLCRLRKTERASRCCIDLKHRIQKSRCEGGWWEHTSLSSS